jgi:predicted esterase
MSHDIHGSSKVNFSDLPASEALEWAKMMPEHSTISFSGELTYPGYKHIPVSFLFCEADIVVSPKLQQSIIDMMENEAGVKVDVHTIRAGHCPNASMPKTVGQVILKIAGQQI